MSAWSQPSKLVLLSRLHDLGFLQPKFIAGEKISRGFADLGFEEFVLIAEARMVSLLSGKVSELPREHRAFFFLVPSTYEILDLVHRLVGFPPDVTLEKGRWWRVSGNVAQREKTGETPRVLTTRRECIDESLLDFLLLSLGGESPLPQSLRCSPA